MTRRRWIADEVFGNRAALTGLHADHLARVLRARIGQEFEISTETETRLGRIISIDPDRVEFELGEHVRASVTPNVTIALSIFKFNRMEWAIEKCTELGVAQIVPVIASRTEAHLAASTPNRVERWRRIAQQAAEQSRRNAPPHIVAPMKLKDAVSLTGSMRIVLAETEEQLPLKHALELYGPGDDLILAFGPEGGWTEAELESFRDAGWTSASLGKLILRAETAAIAAVAIAISELT
ncbi:MAG TPA: RsmE family RNA methyltransferase [Terriglobales bacterium]|nr:RsmE family RNA methyltransferase [Terriglobales bacterium]